MNGEAERARDRLAEVRLDATTIPPDHGKRDHERQVAIADLVDDNVFAVIDRDEGPYTLIVAQSESRLTFAVRSAAGAPVAEFALSMTPFRPLLKDYFLVSESYYSAIRTASPTQIEAVDRERTRLHDEGAALVVARLADKAKIDQGTARRLFTLVSALHWKL